MIKLIKLSGSLKALPVQGVRHCERMRSNLLKIRRIFRVAYQMRRQCKQPFQAA
ncbi:MAG: hypothetical protein IJV35_03055 [Neisseriaceae bacterium]|nr:hypothetical protein [Neisseriaceae bacterium]